MGTTSATSCTGPLAERAGEPTARLIELEPHRARKGADAGRRGVVIPFRDAREGFDVDFERAILAAP